MSQSTPLPFPKSEGTESVFLPLQQEMAVEFAEQFSKLQGRFVFCINEQETGVSAHQSYQKTGLD
ncbi:MAG: hypothetical protein WDO16_11615 [Bacteroidota bacterium]